MLQVKWAPLVRGAPIQSRDKPHRRSVRDDAVLCAGLLLHRLDFRRLHPFDRRERLGERGAQHDWGYGCGECPACALRAKGWREYAGR